MNRSVWGTVQVGVAQKYRQAYRFKLTVVSWKLILVQKLLPIGLIGPAGCQNSEASRLEINGLVR